ncbi:hypothetical protein C5167_021904 [Papaver somniferum]|uniref:Uncharacterized protein n=1 Tax=Papaver somniferum TaxID=3469 RepID=A0A4Y7JK20_PAPSO|nr:hypothetical protein C5167_021904 [Papaver somniferum]
MQMLKMLHLMKFRRQSLITKTMQRKGRRRGSMENTIFDPQTCWNVIQYWNVSMENNCEISGDSLMEHNLFTAAKLDDQRRQASMMRVAVSSTSLKKYQELSFLDILEPDKNSQVVCTMQEPHLDDLTTHESQLDDMKAYEILGRAASAFIPSNSSYNAPLLAPYGLTGRFVHFACIVVSHVVKHE